MTNAGYVDTTKRVCCFTVQPESQKHINNNNNNNNNKTTKNKIKMK